jgi:phage-related minor tail protein
MAGKKGIELLTAYISLVPSIEGLQRSVAEQMGAPMTKAAEDAGDKAGSGFSKAFADKAQKAGLVAGAAVGGALALGMNGALEQEGAKNKFVAQMGISPEESKRLGEISGKLYAGAYGDNLESVNDAVGSVVKNIGGMGTASSDDVEGITGKVMNLAKAFGEEVPSVTTAMGQLMKTGMAKDATEALDIVTRGLQVNGNSAGDLLDTFTEYPAKFQQLGLSGKSTLGIIEQMMAGGARNTDLAADALKEFQIRSVDGSKASAAGYKALGLDAQEMTAKMAKGGADATEGLQQVTDKLRGMTDPVARNEAAVALFGTQAEDLGAALYNIDPSKVVGAADSVAGAGDKMNEAMNAGGANALTAFNRAMQQELITPLLEQVLPVLTDVANNFKTWSPIVIPILAALAGFAAIVWSVTAAMKAWTAIVAIARGAVVVWTGVQWLLNAALTANPIGLIIMAIAALIAIVVLLVMNWDTVVKFVTDIWNGFIGFMTERTENFGRRWNEFWGGVGAFIKQVWDGFVDWIVNVWNSFIGFIVGALVWYVTFWISIWLGIASFIVDVWMGFTEWVSRRFIDMLAGLQLIGSIISSWWSGLWTWVGDFVIGMVTGFVSFIGTGFGQILDFVVSIWTNISTFFAGMWTGLLSGVGDFVNGIGNFFAGIPETIMNVFASAGSWLYNIGKNIVEGLLNGLGDMGKNIGSFFLSTLPGWIVDPFKQALGIQSPSRLFRLFGVNTVEGFIGGVDDSKGMIDNRMDNLVKEPNVPTFANTAMPLNRPKANALSTEGAGGQGGGVVIAPTVNGTDGMDIDMLSDLVIYKIAKQQREMATP